MLAEQLDEENQCLLKETRIPTQAEIGSSEQRHEPRGLNTSWGDWNASLNEVECGNVWRDSMLMRNNYMLEHSMPILHHLADQGNFAYPTYEPPNVPPLGGDDYFTSAIAINYEDEGRKSEILEYRLANVLRRDTDR
ncbi:hypothetical protein Tco_0974214 [Tanacetum coccineum]|uniref:Uncharacterized protein n=1 Tax=Tanacetum coccineum TaxID=301880 RepID=A0ABQ5EBX1_9ASTR